MGIELLTVLDIYTNALVDVMVVIIMVVMAVVMMVVMVVVIMVVVMMVVIVVVTMVVMVVVMMVVMVVVMMVVMMVAMMVVMIVVIMVVMGGRRWSCSDRSHPRKLRSPLSPQALHIFSRELRGCPQGASLMTFKRDMLIIRTLSSIRYNQCSAKFSSLVFRQMMHDGIFKKKKFPKISKVGDQAVFSWC